MAGGATTHAEGGREARTPVALQHRPWRSPHGLSSGLDALERFLAAAGFERAPWLAVAFAAGILFWFAAPARWDWLAGIAAGLGAAAAALALLRADGRSPYLRQAIATLALLAVAGCAVIWAKSALVGAAPIARPTVATITGTVLSRQEQPAERRIRLVLATREPATGRAIRVRINVETANDRPGLDEAPSCACARG